MCSPSNYYLAGVERHDEENTYRAMSFTLGPLPKTTCTIFACQFNKEHCLPGAKGREQL